MIFKDRFSGADNNKRLRVIGNPTWVTIRQCPKKLYSEEDADILNMLLLLNAGGDGEHHGLSTNH